jgi:hypothetical protein
MLPILETNTFYPSQTPAKDKMWLKMRSMLAFLYGDQNLSNELFCLTWGDLWLDTWLVVRGGSSNEELLGTKMSSSKEEKHTHTRNRERCTEFQGIWLSFIFEVLVTSTWKDLRCFWECDNTF